MERWQSQAAPLDLEGMDLEQILGVSVKELSNQLADEVAKEQEKKSTRKGGGKGRTGQTRKKYADIPLTKNLIYKILDYTDQTVYYCEGIGTTERQVDVLLDAGHELKWFTEDKNGKKLRQPMLYQLVLSNRGKHGFREFFQPTDQWKRAKIVRDDEVSKLGLVEVRNWPSVPGGFYFRLVRTDGPVMKGTEEEDYYPSLGKVEAQELTMLHQIAKGPQGGTVVWDFIDDRAIPTIIEQVLNCHLSEQAKKRMLTILQESTTAYPLPPEVAAETNYALADRRKIEQLESEVEALQKRLETAKAVINGQRGLLARDKRLAQVWLGDDPP